MRRFLTHRYFSTRPVPTVPDYYDYIYDMLPYEDPLSSSAMKLEKNNQKNQTTSNLEAQDKPFIKKERRTRKSKNSDYRK